MLFWGGSMFDIKVTRLEETCQDCIPYHFLQTDFWAAFKGMHGWKTSHFLLDAVNTSETTQSFRLNISLIVRRFARFFSIAYIPLGPELPDSIKSSISYDSEAYLILMEDIAKALKSYLPKDCFCLRMDPPVEFHELEDKAAHADIIRKTRILRKSPTDIQPPDTVLFDLTRTEEEQLAAMKPKWRYNIKLAEKKGVAVSANGPEAIDDFYKIFEETASRDGIAVHAKEYYKSLLSMTPVPADAHIKTTLYIARHEGDVLAGIITLFTDTEAVYLYGASSNNKRNLMPAYLLQWTAIKDAKVFGSKVYDFYGIPPTDDEHHPMYGLYRFKTGFGGEVVHRAGSIDLPLKKGVYGCYITAEKLRAFWFKKVKKIFIHKK